MFRYRQLLLTLEGFNLLTSNTLVIYMEPWRAVNIYADE
jgi:hypothetical protein